MTASGFWLFGYGYEQSVDCFLLNHENNNMQFACVEATTTLRFVPIVPLY